MSAITEPEPANFTKQDNVSEQWAATSDLLFQTGRISPFRVHNIVVQRLVTQPSTL